jgi:hypothetical protein
MLTVEQVLTYTQKQNVKNVRNGAQKANASWTNSPLPPLQLTHYIRATCYDGMSHFPSHRRPSHIYIKQYKLPQPGPAELNHHSQTASNGASCNPGNIPSDVRLEDYPMLLKSEVRLEIFVVNKDSDKPVFEHCRFLLQEARCFSDYVKRCIYINTNTHVYNTYVVRTLLGSWYYFRKINESNFKNFPQLRQKLSIKHFLTKLVFVGICWK